MSLNTGIRRRPKCRRHSLSGYRRVLEVFSSCRQVKVLELIRGREGRPLSFSLLPAAFLLVPPALDRIALAIQAVRKIAHPSGVAMLNQRRRTLLKIFVQYVLHMDSLV